MCLKEISHEIADLSQGETRSAMEDFMLSSNEIPSSSARALTRIEKGTGIDGHAANNGSDEMLFMIKLHG